MIIFLLTIIGILIAAICVIYLRTAKILAAIDKMLDSAINDTFSESDFTEHKLSMLEAKMYRFLMSGRISLKKINAEKDGVKTLIADISHQTKTPLANILLYAQLLKEIPDLDENAKEIAQQIENQTEKLNFLIASLIKTSRLENGIINVVPKETSVNKLLEAIDFKSAAAEKQIILHIEPAPPITAVFDFKWTLEAIANIVDNAIKYTPRGGKVLVTADEYEMFVRIDIADTGIGISEDDTAKIFTRFYRSADVSDENGVGIGLYLAREIIANEGGYIKVASEKGKGSTFSVFLPKNSNLSKL